jgi:predicted DNA-binding transcriptional regulator AlpA
MNEPPKLVLSREEAARATGLSARTLQRLHVDGGGPAAVQLTERRVGYRPEALNAWLNERQVASTAAAAVVRQAKAK